MIRGLEMRIQRDPVATASAVQNNATVAVTNNFNDFSTQNQIELVFTADNAAGTAATSTIALLPGVGKGAIIALPSGITITGGDYSTWADWINYAQNVPMLITNIFMQSADTSNYGGRLTLGEIMPNGTIPNPSYKQLTNYRVSTGNGYSDVINISDVKLVTVPHLQTKFDIKKNTSIRVILTVQKMVASAQLTEVSF